MIKLYTLIILSSLFAGVLWIQLAEYAEVMKAKQEIKIDNWRETKEGNKPINHSLNNPMVAEEDIAYCDFLSYAGNNISAEDCLKYKLYLNKKQ